MALPHHAAPFHDCKSVADKAFCGGLFNARVLNLCFLVNKPQPENRIRFGSNPQRRYKIAGFINLGIHIIILVGGKPFAPVFFEVSFFGLVQAVARKYSLKCFLSLSCGKIEGDEEQITCRPADLIEPELEKYTHEAARYMIQPEDALTKAMFPVLADKFFSKREERMNKIDNSLLIEEDECDVYPV